MDSNYEIDYKAMLDQLFAKLNERLDMENEYFTLLQYITENSASLDVIMKNLTKMPMCDQVLVLRSVAKLYDTCLRLQTKHDFIEEEEQ